MTQHYLAKAIPEELKKVAEEMYVAGETDEAIGKAIKHHMHDYDKEGEDIVRLYLVKREDGPGHDGAVALIPDKQEYTGLFTDYTPHDFVWDDTLSTQARTYNVTDTDSVEQLVAGKLALDDWQNSEFGVWTPTSDEEDRL